MKRFEIVTRLAAPPERVFEASLDVETHLGSMADSGEHVVGGVTAGQLKLGDSVTWRATHFGIQWRMRVLITACEPPNFFVDEQVHGPFKRWHHAHYFENDGASGTVMRDVVEFAAPLGPLGAIAEAVVLKRYMPKLIRQRNEYLKAHLAS
ncbi:SRPBCC family protein [Sinomonas sp. G460-2]|uniref:SRPBCC family protein n=1 Tax=Sinomonas sp. G460-2 TaxID=3393464 RepID=UPI0039EF8406